MTTNIDLKLTNMQSQNNQTDNEKKYIDLTAQQKNIWNLQNYYPETAIGNQCGAIFYEEKRDIRILEQAINIFIKKQSGFRLRFIAKGEAKQFVADYEPIEISYRNFESEQEFNQFASEYAKKKISIDDEMQFRFLIFELDGKSGVLVCLSHLISDAWTFSLLVSEVDKAYRFLNNEVIDDLFECDYLEYVESERRYLESEKYQHDEAFWQSKYASCPEETYIKMNTSTSNSIEANRLIVKVPDKVELSIRELCKSHTITEAVLFETAMMIYLHRINGDKKSATIGIPVLNRCNAKEKHTAGMFVSTMPLTVMFEDDMTVAELSAQITKSHMEIFRHQKYPYSEILRFIRENQHMEGNMYHVMMSYQNATTGTNNKTSWYFNGYSEVPFIMHIDNRDGDNNHTITIDYQTAVFHQENEINLILERLLYIIVQICENDSIKVADIVVVPKKEKQLLLEKFNDTYIDYSRDKCIHELFSMQAKKTPDRVAVVFKGKRIKYSELDRMSNALARYLREMGTQRGDIVPIIAHRSWHVLVAMIGVLKSGAAYMPVDPTYPVDRINEMMNIAGVKIALTYQYDSNVNTRTIKLDEIQFNKYDDLDNCNDVNDLCYIIFTSGSTGKPKGVSITHKNVSNYCHNNSNNNVCYSIISDRNKSIVSITNIIFDIFATESIMPLLNGLTVYFADDKEAVSQKELSELINNNPIDVIQTTPTRMRSLMADKTNLSYLDRLKTVILGGEAFPLDLARELQQFSSARIFNIYGPAETTVWSSNSVVLNEKADITIGRPIANTQIYILDKYQSLLPLGVTGELCIAGDGVGKGYLNRPDLTAERFVPNPFATEENGHGPIMYKTGDLARWREDGEIEYLGRIDTQVKIRGLRIELGEIENVMSEYDGIQLAAVADKRDENNRQYLVGYYTSKESVDEKELRHYLSLKLPKYMVPNYFVYLEEMPMTASGKTDRKNLPVPDYYEHVKDYTAPINETEITLASIWSELLQIDIIGRDDDFFEMGGDSLIAITMIAMVEEEFRVDLSVKDIFENPTLHQFAEVIESENESVIEISSDKAYAYSLLPQQKALYIEYSKNPNSLVYNMPCSITFPDNINRDCIKECLRQLLVIHPELNTYITTKKGELIADYSSNTELLIEEYNDENISGFVRPFDLTKAPLFRVAFTETSMLLDSHHIIMDGGSLMVIIKDIAALYEGKTINTPLYTFADYAKYYYSTDHSPYKEYFKKYLKYGIEPLVLPHKKKERNDVAKRGASVIYTIEKDLTKIIRTFCTRKRFSETMVFLAAYGILLKKYTNAENISTGIVLTNREKYETHKMLGMFVNTIPVIFPDVNKTEEYLSLLKDAVLDLYKYQELPYLEIANAASISDLNALNTSFVYQAYGRMGLLIDEQLLELKAFNTGTTKFDLTIEITPEAEQTLVQFEYDSEKYDENLMQRMFDSYCIILQSLEKEFVSDIIVIQEEERNRLLLEYNDTTINYPKEKCVHELFRIQASKTPNRTALVFEDKRFTYSELDRMSNAICNYLRERGIPAKSIVGIAAERDWRVIVAMLGIMKAGCAYLPIDINLPAKRITYMLDTAQCHCVLTYKNTAMLNIDEFSIDDALKICDEKKDITSISSEDACYVLFTSGSTGLPKAVTITHRNLGNFTNNNNNNNNNMFQCAMVNSCHSVLADTTFVFDVSVFEIFLSLINGLKVVLSGGNNSADHLALLIEKEEVDVFHSTPTKLEMLMKSDCFCKAMCCFKMIMVGAEVFPLSLFNKIKEHTRATVYNGYGPTETTIGVTFKRINNRHQCIHRVFSERAGLCPEKTAIIFDGDKITYKELDELTNYYAKEFRSLGVKPGVVVPIIANRSWKMIAAMLSVIKAGGAYFLIDSNYPKERIHYLVDECSGTLLIGDQFQNYKPQYFDLETIGLVFDKEPPISMNGPDNPLCVIHTSGSTGKPKATVLSHANIMNFCMYADRLFEGIDYTLSTTSIAFDAFQLETIVALCNLSTIVLFTDTQMMNQTEFEKLVCQYKRAFLFQTPTKLMNFIRNSQDKEFLKHIDIYVVGGEVFPQELADIVHLNNSSAKVCNIYGPTESTICVTTDEVVVSEDITIGRPIANTQIYILDKYQSLLPLGVAGELCIAGDGVGKGYLNRPDLTAERFVANPFATEENGHGPIMYKTGDLARWREDGEIEYLGRIDTQVKIRGLRIELGEIESVMSEYDGIQLAAVAEKKDENNRQYLVGYYTAKESIDENELRHHLATKLPKYMVPNYFMHLDEMPMTASGKTDRKNLPVPVFGNQDEEYIAPETEQEKCLCEILQDILCIEKVGSNYDFFEHGGDSLGAITYVAQAHGHGIEFDLQNVFDYPTVHQLCEFLNSGKQVHVVYEAVDFEKYEEIFNRNQIDENFVPEKRELGNVLVTGATGFLGAHVVDELMRETDGIIYCLVRGTREEDIKGRIGETLKYYFGDTYESEIGKRIIPIMGDIEKEGLFEAVTEQVDTVIHTAASVKHYGSYSYFHRVNVEGTNHVVNYAKEIGAKLIHVSTLSVSGNSLADDFSVYHSEEEKFFYESSFYIGQPLDNVYIRSKFEAEKCVYDAILDGLDAKVVRVGNLTNRASDYKFQKNYKENAFLTRMKAGLEFGMFPDYLMELYSEFSPIDKTAQGIVKIAKYAQNQTVFHLNSDRVVYFDRLLEILQQLGIPMRVVSSERFNEELQATIKSNKKEYIFEAFQNDMDKEGKLIYDSNIRIKNDFTLWFLKRVGFEWNETDYEYIKGYIEYFRSIGYLEI